MYQMTKPCTKDNKHGLQSPFLTLRPSHQSIIETKWVYRNKLDEHGMVVQNKARLVAKGYNQEERIDYEETYAPVARPESIIMLCAFACYKNITLY